jgi:hypothetical protein
MVLAEGRVGIAVRAMIKTISNLMRGFMRSSFYVLKAPLQSSCDMGIRGNVQFPLHPLP